MSSASDPPILRHVAATVHGRVLVRPAQTPAPWLVGFHGYAQTAAVFLEPLERTAPPGWLVASVQALHPFYAGRTNTVVANWMTREDRELAIADNIAYVDAVLDDLERGFGAPRAIVFAGFSQGVAMAYRAGVRGRRRAAAIVAAGGDLPPELAEPGPRDWPQVLAATGAADPAFTPARLEQDAVFLRTRSIEVRTLVFDGGHAWADEVVAATRSLLEGIAATIARGQT
jgi:predicted esterase